MYRVYRSRDKPHALLVPAVHTVAREVPHRILSDRDVASTERVLSEPASSRGS